MNPKELPSISVIILNFNGAHYLKDCFSSLMELDYPKPRLELLLVDNNSSDNSIELVRAGFKDVKILKLDNNYGFAEGNNLGVLQAKNEYIVFLNNDTVVDRNWLKELAVSAIKEPRLIATSKVIYFHDRETLNIGRGHINRWGIGFCKGAGERQELFNESILVHHATGCSMMLKKSDFNDIGCFDKDFFAYHEDIDLSWRAWIKGYKIKFVPTSIVYHRSGGTAGAFSPFKTYLVTRNTLTYILKNCETRYIISMLPLNMLFFVAVSMFLIFPISPLGFRYSESLRLSGATLRGISDFIKGSAICLKKRAIIQKGRKVSDSYLLKNGLIMSFGESLRHITTSGFKTVRPLIKANTIKEKKAL